MNYLSKRTVYVETHTWKDCDVIFSFGAIHYYGTFFVRKPDGAIFVENIEKRVTAEEARVLNREEREKSDLYFIDTCIRYKEGDICNRFHTEKQVLDVARTTWKELFPWCDYLVYGSPSIAEPQPVLEGLDPFKSKVNDLAKAAADIGYWEHDNKQMRAICKEWKDVCDEEEKNKGETDESV